MRTSCEKPPRPNRAGLARGTCGGVVVRIVSRGREGATRSPGKLCTSDLSHGGAGARDVRPTLPRSMCVVFAETQAPAGVGRAHPAAALKRSTQIVDGWRQADARHAHRHMHAGHAGSNAARATTQGGAQSGGGVGFRGHAGGLLAPRKKEQNKKAFLRARMRCPRLLMSCQATVAGVCPLAISPKPASYPS